MVQQLSVRFPTEIVEVYNKRKETGFSAGSLGFQECYDLLLSLIGKNSQTTIIIDALDESYPEKRRKLLEALKAFITSSMSLVKVFVSSRDDDDITLVLKDVPNVYIQTTDNIDDIERFTRRGVADSIQKERLLRGNVSGELEQRVIETLLNEAHGM